MGLQVKKGEYAKLRGVAASYITKLIGKGLVVLTPDGKRVDVEASNAKIADAEHVDRQGVREHHARERLAAEINPRTAGAGEMALYPTNGAAAPTPGGPGPGAWDGVAPPAQAPYRGRAKDADAFNEARAKKEGELARLAELERLEREGALVSADSVRMAAGRIAGAIVKGLDRVGPRLAEKLAAEADPVKCNAMLEEEVRQIREELAEEILKLGTEGDHEQS